MIDMDLRIEIESTEAAREVAEIVGGRVYPNRKEQGARVYVRAVTPERLEALAQHMRSADV